MTDERLVASALAYARFRARFGSVLGLVYLLIAATAVPAALGSPAFPRIMYTAIGGGWLLTGIVWLWLANRCRRGARATTDVHRSLR